MARDGKFLIRSGIEIFLLLLCVGRFWLMTLPSSFWVDELGSVFVGQRAADPSLAAVPQLPVSLYFWLPRASEALLGFSEITYRLPSVIMMALALYMIAKLAARLIDPAAAWLAVFMCLGIGDIDYFAVDARPYALGMFVATASVYFLIRWLDSARWTHALAFLFFAALLWRVHLVFWAFYPILLLYTAGRLLRGTTTVNWMRAFLVWAMLAIALIPVAVQAVGLLATAGAHSFAPRPSIFLFIAQTTWRWTVVCGLLAVLVPALLQWKPDVRMTRSAMALVVLWWLWLPICLFFYSRHANTVLFVPRYYSLALPGAALCAAAIVAIRIPRRCWKGVTILVAIAALALNGKWSDFWPNHTQEDWRQAAIDEDLAAIEPDTPVIAPSPYIEAKVPVWSQDYRLPGFLYAPEYVYPVRGRIYPFPYLRSPETERYAAKLLTDSILSHNRFIVYGVATSPWIKWIAGQPGVKGWKILVNGNALVRPVIFVNPELAPY